MNANYNSHYNAVLVTAGNVTYVLDFNEARKLREELDEAIGKVRI